MNYRKWLINVAFTGLVAVGALQPVLAADKGGSLTYGRYADSQFLDPVQADQNVDIWILTNLYDTLLQPTSDGKGVDFGLASAKSWSDDHRVLTLTLRPGIRFSDGSPITVDDVQWSLQRASKQDNGIWAFLLAAIDKVDVDGSDKVKISLKNYDPAFEAALATFNAAILPKKAFEATAGATDADKARAFSEHPIGSGPFMLDSWHRGSDMVLKANPYYWEKDQAGVQLPYLDQLHFEIIPDDATRILKLTSGELDGAEQIPYSRVAELKANSAVDMELFPSTKVTFMTMNTRPEVGGHKNPLNDVRVRQALNYALNKDALTKIVTHGVAKPMQSYLSSTTPLFSGDGEPYPYNAAKAKQLLADAGVAPGTEISIYTLGGSQDEMQIATAAQQMWAAAGIKLKIEQIDKATRAAKQKASDFQMVVSTWTNDIADPNEATSYFAYFPLIQSYRSGWQNKDVDKLYEDSQVEADAAKRAAQYAKIQEVFKEGAPIVYMYESPYPVALSKKVKGFVQIPLGNNVFTKTSRSK
ncbi:ABC transporter substrate-binding protein [Rhizobium leguminosarum]|uniref:ABC transporter substrate-binding protein n=1 Tax=Rhizobium leguminosarum TaxID=384 RepID=UPI001C91DC63|nr:ABC transporter substrate-binding protein [Rhizobium leguminosarum]MBY2915361.1 ABC transporter substrate-binding protein [Rhizobium leguminosarum]MBY2970899.1 ABC transporter substrate-binding protein [Rhizobium leguminosarum]MBY2977966.1 ABC transporter substrate-binding protein [Rhizobium leguminosarum]MBY3006516.1 ABC transporter substrate-binding protein [Rhizobium leguminosarum]